jgi:hypothetical protein
LLVEVLRAATAALLHRAEDYSVFWLVSRFVDPTGKGPWGQRLACRPGDLESRGFVQIRRFALWG